MSRFRRGRDAFPETVDRRYPDEAAALALSAEATERPSWRYRMLLLAIGSSTPDGSDVTASDRDILLRMDTHLIKCAIREGEEAAEAALVALIEVLRGDANEPQSRLN